MKDFEFEAQPDDEGGGDPDCSTMHTEMTLDEGSVNNFSKTLNKMPFDGRRKVRESPLCAPSLGSTSSTSPASPSCHPVHPRISVQYSREPRPSLHRRIIKSSPGTTSLARSQTRGTL